VQDNKKGTCLHHAARFGCTEVVSMLIDKGARVNHQDIYKQTALFLACGHGKTETVKCLLQKQVDVNFVKKGGLHYMLLVSLVTVMW
jgi:ankyrin repeat protein